MVLIQLLLFIFFSNSIFSFENDFHISVGFGVSSAEFRSKIVDQDKRKDEDETETKAFGLSTRFGYKLIDNEFGILSDVGFGKVEHLTINNSAINVSDEMAHYRIVTISPYYKYIFLNNIYADWSTYFGISPSWSLQTLTFDSPRISSEYRLSFENFGFGLFVGVEESLAYKEMHPSFLEVGYSYSANYKTSLIDASKTSEAVLLKSYRAKNLTGHFWFFRFGLVLF